jgi:hypothetical protein
MFFYYLPFILVPFILATSVMLYLLAAGSRNELEEKAPEYAHMLYRSFAQQLLYRTYPVRVFVLFFQPAPSAVKGSITALRVVVIFHLALLVALFIVFILSY